MDYVWRKNQAKAAHTQDGMFRPQLCPTWNPEEGPGSAHLPPGLEMVDEGRLSLLTLQLNRTLQSPLFVKRAFPFGSDDLD